MSKKQKLSKARSLVKDFTVLLGFSFVAVFIALHLLSSQQTGVLGYWLIEKTLKPLFGEFIYYIPFLIIFHSVMRWFTPSDKRKRMNIGFVILYVVGPFAFSLQHFIFTEVKAGGLLGNFIYQLLDYVLGRNGSLLLLFVSIIFAVLCISPLSLLLSVKALKQTCIQASKWFWSYWTQKAFWKSFFYEAVDYKKKPEPKSPKKEIAKKWIPNEVVKSNDQITFERRSLKKPIQLTTTVQQTQTAEYGYQLPSIDTLATANTSEEMIRKREALALQQSDVLEEALASFNVKAKVVHISAGPSVIRYELAPGDGVKISKITTLSQDIALKMAAPSVRIEAPIPGKSLVGIEVPAPEREAVFLRNIIEQTDFLTDKNILTSCLGLTITGAPITFNLAEMPHLLIAGATGSGKSVCVNTIIMSILLRARPDQVKFVMIDPKKVELSLYDDIPHLLAPVVTNPQMAAATLKQWALKEMEQRYELFSKIGVKDLAGHNKAMPESPLPHIVVIIDELADLMMVASQEVENTICRLAQMARATGIHLVIATQRPSVNVVTGLIKANVPSRIAFFVQSQIDSRTILDVAGAEKLLGKGDMLYSPVGKPAQRLQGVFISEEDIKSVVDFIKGQAKPEYSHDLLAVEIEEVDDKTDLPENVDALFEEAKEIIQSTQKASISYLQRKLKIGYNRAARLMDQLEEQGVIGAYDEDSKSRPVF